MCLSVHLMAKIRRVIVDTGEEEGIGSVASLRGGQGIIAVETGLWEARESQGPARSEGK